MGGRRGSQLRRSNAMVEEYSRLAQHYDARWSFYVGATVRSTMARMSVGAADRVLDVGCGTGALLQQLALSCPTALLCGVDPVAEMLDVARRRLPANVQLREGWAESLPFEDGEFDAVVSCSTLHYIREPMRALQEMRRVLRPGGRLTITDWCDDYLACRLCDLWLRVFRRAHFRTYGARECMRLLEGAGLTEATLERYKINWWWALMTASARNPK